MNKIRAIVSILAVAAASGCAMPMTPGQFRSFATAHTTLMKTATFTVDRPFVNVARTLRVESGRCLDKRVNLTFMEPGMYGTEVQGTSTNVYHSTWRVLPTGAELAVQMLQVDADYVQKIPKRGPYELVADIRRLGPRKTHVHVYYDRFGADLIFTTVTGWATGKNTGCPDLTR